MALPRPVWSDDDANVAQEVARKPSNLIRSTWNDDPTKIAVLRAMVSCQVRIGFSGYFRLNMFYALSQGQVSPSFVFTGSGGSRYTNPFQLDSYFWNIFKCLSEYPDFCWSPVPEENHEAS